jgi:hypothetical protein
VPGANDIRSALLAAIDRQGRDRSSSNLQSGSVLQKASLDLGLRGRPELERALLTQFHELFRTGYLAWGFDLSNPDPPFFHLTEQGQRTLAQLSSDPGNPQGYLRRIDSIAPVNVISRSYLEEGLQCYVADHYKASAVMVGAAAESLVLELRDAVVNKLKSLSQITPHDLDDWRVARILAGLKAFFDAQSHSMPSTLKAEYASYWTAFTQQIRAVRNEAGHPSSVDPITLDAVHASLLIFPELLKLAGALRTWVGTLT